MILGHCRHWPVAAVSNQQRANVASQNKGTNSVAVGKVLAAVGSVLKALSYVIVEYNTAVEIQCWTASYVDVAEHSVEPLIHTDAAESVNK